MTARECTPLQTMGHRRQSYDDGKEYQGRPCAMHLLATKESHSPCERLPSKHHNICADQHPQHDAEASATGHAIQTRMLIAQHLTRMPVAQWSTDISLRGRSIAQSSVGSILSPGQTSLSTRVLRLKERPKDLFLHGPRAPRRAELYRSAAIKQGTLHPPCHELGAATLGVASRPRQCGGDLGFCSFVRT